MKVIAATRILAANDRIAVEVRTKLRAAGTFAVNVLGSPGAGKTALLEALLPRLGASSTVAVIEGDLETTRDADRIAKYGVSVVQVNTGGGCHLNAGMVASALEELDLKSLEILFIENVGNLVCPAGFDLGETSRLVVFSVTEGDDKIAKYPTMFGSVDAIALNKIDLLPYTDFSTDKFMEDLKRLSREVKVFHVSAKTGEGVEELAEWLRKKR
jgi:hydrogenase nickel incorporation protein HypB